MGSGVCGSGEKIVYAWGRNAPELKLPNGKYSIFSGPFKHNNVKGTQQMDRLA